jgi:integrase
MVGIYKRGDILYIQYKVNGKNIQKSTKLKDTKQNRKLLQDEVIPLLKVKLLNSEFDKNKIQNFEYYSVYYLESKEHYKTYFQIKNQTDLVNNYFGNLQIDRITKHDVKKWVHLRMDKEGLYKNSSKTVKDYMTHVTGVLDVAIDMEHLTNNVSKNIKLPTHITEVVQPFTSEEVSTLLKNSNSWFRLYLAIAFYTGLRTGEIMALTRNDIDLKKKVVQVTKNLVKGNITTTKTELSVREVPIFNDLIPYLENLPRTIFLFTNSEGTHTRGAESINKEEWKRLLKRSNIEYRKLYATRHTFTVSMLRHSELTLMQVAQILGHTTIEMLIRNYAKYIKGEHLKVSRDLKLFTDKVTDIS